MPDGTHAVPLRQFLAHLERLSTVELRFVVEALHDGAVTSHQDALAHPEDGDGSLARVMVLNALWTRLLSDVNTRLGHAAAAE